MRNYIAIMVPADDGTWGSYVPDLPGCTSGGTTRGEAVRSAREAIEGHIELLREMGQPIPEPVSSAEIVQIG